MTVTKEQTAGCLLGLAMGDSLGAPHEGGPLERALWRLLGTTRDGLPRWTDDTQMTIDLVQSLLAVGALDQDHLANQFAQSYHWRRGYGPGTAAVLKRIRRGQSWQMASRAVHRSGSFGNGAAMRAAPLALFFVDSDRQLIAQTRRSAAITHAHPLGIEGAVIVAIATRYLLAGTTASETMAAVMAHSVEPAFQEKLRLAQGWLNTNAHPAPAEVAERLGNRMLAVESCVSALYIALRHLDSSFDALMQFAIAGRGDVDTIAAMAGAMWGAHRGVHALPTARIEQQALLESLAEQLHQRQSLAQ